MKFVFRNATKAIVFIRLVSADIVLGALSGSYFASVIFNISLSIYFYFTLAAAVWVIYTADHILDGLKIGVNQENEVYEFHKKHRIALLIVGSILSLITGLVVLFLLESKLIDFGLTTFALISLYLVFNQISRKKNWFFPKELVIAILYTWGIFGGAFIIEKSVNWFQLMAMINYFFLVLANVFLFSFYNFDENRKDRFKIISFQIGRKQTKHSIIALLVIAFCLSLIIGFISSEWSISFILMFMNFMFFILIFFFAYFENKIYLAFITDSVFWIPFLILFVS